MLFSNKTSDLALAVLSIIALSYTVVRVFSLSITYDEAWAFKSILAPRDLSLYKHFSSLFYKDANNHFLNTVLMRLGTWILGYDEWVLRLPVLGGHLMYLYFTRQLARDLHKGFAGVAVFTVLNFNPFVLDFFSIARGYGLAMGLMAGSLFYFSRYFRGGCNNNSLIWGLWFASLSVFANLSFLNVYCALLCMYFAREFYLNRRRDEPHPPWPLIKGLLKGDNNRIALNLLVTFGLNGLFIARLANAGALVHGTDDGLWDGSIASLIEYTLYGEPYWWVSTQLIIGMVKGTLVVLIPGYLACKTFTASSILDDDTLYLGLLLLCGLSVYLQNILLSVPFPLDRTTLLFFPLFVLTVFTGLIGIARYAPAWINLLCTAYLLVLSTAAGVHALKTMNLDSTYIWRIDEESEAIMQKIADDSGGLEGDGPFVINIDREWRLESGFNYYIFKLGLDNFTEVVRKRGLPDPESTYIIMDRRMIDASAGPLIPVARWSKQPLWVMRLPAQEKRD